MDAFWPVMSLLPSTLVAVAFLSRNARKRWSLRRVRADLLEALTTGADLTAIEHELAYLVAELRPDLPSTHDPDLRLLHAVAAMERLDFDLARTRLDSMPRHDAGSWARTRLALLRAQPDVVEPRDPAPSLLDVIVDDTRAMLALATAPTKETLEAHPRALPATRARLLAAAGRDEEALALLATLAPTRLEALCRAFPADAVVLLHARSLRPTPYR